MLNIVTSPVRRNNEYQCIIKFYYNFQAELQTNNLNENATVHMIIFSNPEGISNEVKATSVQNFTLTRKPA